MTIKELSEKYEEIINLVEYIRSEDDSIYEPSAEDIALERYELAHNPLVFPDDVEGFVNDWKSEIEERNLPHYENIEKAYNELLGNFDDREDIAFLVEKMSYNPVVETALKEAAKHEGNVTKETIETLRALEKDSYTIACKYHTEEEIDSWSSNADLSVPSGASELKSYIEKIIGVEQSKSEKPAYVYEGVFLNPRDIQQIVRAVNIQNMIELINADIQKDERLLKDGGFMLENVKEDIRINQKVIEKLKENFTAIANSRENVAQEIDEIIKETDSRVFGTIEESISSWKPTLDPHITTSFAGGKLPYESFGKQVTVTVDGYSRDMDKGLFALHVSAVSSADEKINEAVRKTAEKTPLHITIANGPDMDGKMTKPVQSRELFEDGMEYTHFEKPFTIQGSYGGFIPEQSRENSNIRIDILSPKERKFKEHVEEKLAGRTDEFANAFHAANAKDPGDKRLYLLQTMEQRIEGPANFGSDFGKITPVELFDKFADIAYGKDLQQKKDILDFDVKQPSDYSMLHHTQAALMRINTELAHLKTDYSNKYGEALPNLIETTERDIKNGDARPRTRTFEISMEGNSGVIDIDALPDNAVLYTEKTHGDKFSVLATGIEKEPVDVAHLIFGTNKDGECSFFLTAFPGPIKPPFELDKDIMYKQRVPIEVSYSGLYFTTRERPIEEYDILTKEQAKELGITFVKYSPELPDEAKGNLKEIINNLEAVYKEAEEYEFPLEDLMRMGDRISAFEQVLKGDDRDMDKFDQPEGKD